MSTEATAATESTSSDAADLPGIVNDFLYNGSTLADIKGLSNDELEAVYTVGYNLYTGGKFDEAVKVFQFLCFFSHLTKKYWMALGGCWHMLKEHAKAVEAYSVAGMLDISDPRPASLAADSHLALGNRDAAISGYTAAVEFAADAPQYATVKERAAGLLELLNKNNAGGK